MNYLINATKNSDESKSKTPHKMPINDHAAKNTSRHSLAQANDPLILKITEDDYPTDIFRDEKHSAAAPQIQRTRYSTFPDSCYEIKHLSLSTSSTSSTLVMTETSQEEREFKDEGKLCSTLIIPSTERKNSNLVDNSSKGSKVRFKDERKQWISKKFRRIFRKKQKQLALEEIIEHIRGVEQPKRFHDVIFALLFLAQISFIVWLAIDHGAPIITGFFLSAASSAKDSEMMYEENADTTRPKQNDFEVDFQNVIKLACVCGAYACIMSEMLIGFMMILTSSFIQSALIFSVCMSLAWGVIGLLMMPSSLVPMAGAVVLVVSLGYAFIVWERIPFAAANLNAALHGVRSNLSLSLVAHLMVLMTFLWNVCWIVAFIGIYQKIKKSDKNCEKLGIFGYVMLSLSYLWTFQVIKNVLQVCVAGTIGNWWFNPQRERCCCSDAVKKSLIRSVTYSFGSICFGSLFAGLAHVIQIISEQLLVRNDSVLSCLNGFVMSCIDKLMEHSNRWAFAYVGLYGYGYMKSAKNAMAIFGIRGWTKVIRDNLVNNILLMCSIAISLATGCFSLLNATLYEYGFSTFPRPEITAFLIGTGIGFSLSSVLLSIISSSVNTVVVCFAAAQKELRINHEKLGTEMRYTWRQVWSDDII